MMLYNALNPHGGDIYGGNVLIDFSANTNPFGMPKSIKEAICACVDALDHYPDPFCRTLVSMLAEHEKVPKEYVLIGAGAAELIYSFAFAQKPKLALELAPTFAEYSLPLEGTRIERFILKESDGFTVNDEILELIKKIRPDTVFLCSPNNPTGRVIAPELLNETARLCQKLGIRLFLDECFMDLSDNGESLVPLLGELPGLIILKAFTKSFGMAGVRLGYALCSDASLLGRMAQSVQPWNVSSVAQAAGTAALSNMAFIEKTRAYIKEERPKLAAGLEKLGFKVFPSNANFLLFKGGIGLDSRLLEKGIKIRNCSNYRALSDGFYRIAVKLESENQRLLAELKTIVDGE